MRFRSQRLQFLARSGFLAGVAWFAVAWFALLDTSLQAAQFGNQYPTTELGGYGGPVAQPPAQGYGVSQSMQASQPNSGNQFMSPDHWGSSGARGSDPFSAAVPPSALTDGRQGFGSPKVNRSSDFSTQLATEVAPGYRYESTGAPSMQSLLGNQGGRVPARPNGATPRAPFRPAEFNVQDPKDIPLAPMVEGRVVDQNDRSLDGSVPGDLNEGLDVGSSPAESQSAPSPGLSLNPPSAGPVSQGFESSNGLAVPNLQPPATKFEGEFEAVEANQYPKTNSAPFVPSMTGPATHYEMPQVFNAAPTNTVAAPAMSQQTTVDSSGFGWGNAPGVLQRQSQPINSQQMPVISQVPSHVEVGPRFPLPFGLNSGRLRQGIEGRPKFLKSKPETPQQDVRGGLLNKPIDPNTYPPQPVPHGQQPVFPTSMPNSQFRPDLGQRSALPTIRNAGTYDSGRTEYDFEDKKVQYPPFSEILATGRWFGSVEGQFLKPRFNGNSGITSLDQSGAADFVDARVFDFDFELAPSFRFGFESKYGPGFEIDYRNVRADSDVQSFTAQAGTSATLSAGLPGSIFSSAISTSAAGQTLSGSHALNFESIGFSVFKEVQLPITRINGMFGFQAVDIDHRVNGTVVDGGGAVLETFTTVSDMRAFGPRIRLEYYRPVGHTPFEFVTQAGGSLMFGRRDQFIGGGTGGNLQRVDVDEIVSSFEFLTALQVKKRIREKRSVYGRIGYVNQVFNSGGSGAFPQDDFGLRGITLMAGINR